MECLVLLGVSLFMAAVIIVASAFIIKSQYQHAEEPKTKTYTAAKATVKFNGQELTTPRGRQTWSPRNDVPWVLLAQQVREGKTNRKAIAREFNVNLTTVKSKLKALGVPPGDSGATPLEKRIAIQEAMVSGELSTAEVAKQFGVSTPTVRKISREAL
jgi:transposase-like protein